tara:strand:- start:2718 stop:3008 length:291 start_codon:yes stop_codon:yes gene_type:complete
MTTGVKTRSGRISKKPDRLELFEEVEDDYKEDEYDSDVDLLQSDNEDFCTDDEEEEEEEYDSDEDENGNLKDFVVDDEEEDEEYSDEEDEEYSDEE